MYPHYINNIFKQIQLLSKKFVELSLCTATRTNILVAATIDICHHHNHSTIETLPVLLESIGTRPCLPTIQHPIRPTITATITTKVKNYEPEKGKQQTIWQSLYLIADFTIVK